MNIFKQLKTKHADASFIYGWTALAAIVFLSIGFLFDIVGIATLFTLFIYLFILISVHLMRYNQQNLKYQQQKNQSILSIHSTLQPDLPIPTMTGWAAEPELIENILKEIYITKPDIIFEIGSGTSSILSAMLLNKIGKGSIISIDHDARYYDSNQSDIDRYGVSELVSLHHAPLKVQQVNGNSYNWYDINGIEINAKIDLLVIDGPPSKTNKLARYPSVPMLYEHLSDDAVIILDDASRPDEIEMVKHWTNEYPDLKASFIPSEKGIAVLRRTK